MKFFKNEIIEEFFEDKLAVIGLVIFTFFCILVTIQNPAPTGI